MSIESIVQEYLSRYGISSVSFDSKGMFNAKVENLGLFSCERIGDGILIGIFKDISPQDKADFIERALKAGNPVENDSLYSMRPVIYDTKAGMVAPVEKDAITLQTISTIVDNLYRTLQNAMRI